MILLVHKKLDASTFDLLSAIGKSFNVDLRIADIKETFSLTQIDEKKLPALRVLDSFYSINKGLTNLKLSQIEADRQG